MTISGSRYPIVAPVYSPRDSYRPKNPKVIQVLFSQSATFSWAQPIEGWPHKWRSWLGSDSFRYYQEVSLQYCKIRYHSCGFISECVSKTQQKNFSRNLTLCWTSGFSLSFYQRSKIPQSIGRPSATGLEDFAVAVLISE